MTTLAAVSLVPPGASCAALAMCAPLEGVGSVVGHVAGDAARGASTDAAIAIFHALLTSLTRTASEVSGHMLTALLQRAGPGSLGASWFTGELDLMAKVAGLVVVPLLLAATVGALLRQDPGRLLRTWLVWLPLAATLTVVMVQLVDVALSATDQMTSVVTGDLSPNLKEAITNLGPSVVTVGGGLLAAILGGLILLGSLVIWLEMVVRSSAILIATFFLPLILAGLVWPATAHVVRRTVEVLAALILSKFVVGAVLGLGVAALANQSVSHGTAHAVAHPDVLAGVAILLLAAFAPMAVLRLVPLVEAAAISHLEGRARQPMRAVRDAAQRMPGQMPLAARLLGAGGSGLDGGHAGAGEADDGGGGGGGGAATFPAVLAGIDPHCDAEPGAGATAASDDGSAAPGCAAGEDGRVRSGGPPPDQSAPTSGWRSGEGAPASSWAMVAPAGEDLG